MSSEESTRSTVLDLVIENGPVTAVVLARILNLTTAAIRRHISYLEEEGLIAVHEPCAPKSRGRGRPARYYVATAKGRDELPAEYSDLATKALGYMQQIAGDAAIEKFAAARSRDIERRYAPVLRDAGNDPRERARALADALTTDGYAATVRDVGDGTFAVQLCQGHCPVQAVAGEFPQLCEAETAAFARLLDVHVQRLATLAGGEHVCTTNIPVAIPKPGSLRKQAANPKEGKGNR